MEKSYCHEEIFMHTFILQIKLSLVPLFSRKELEESDLY